MSDYLIRCHHFITDKNIPKAVLLVIQQKLTTSANNQNFTQVTVG